MSTPPLDPDDSRLTAYALGEADAADRQAVEKMLAESADCRAEVEQTREIVRLLAAGYARERELYLASRPAAALPSNVVAFRTESRRSWRQVATLALKAAALVTLMGSLAYLTLRKPRRPEVVTLAPAPPVEVDASPASGVVGSPRVSKDKSVAARDQDQMDAGRSSESDQPDAVAAAPAPFDLGSPLPSAEEEAAKSTVTAPRLAAARQAAEAPAGAAGRAAVAPPLLGGAVAADEQVAPSVVRVRTATGVFFGGVVVSGDGLILASTDLPEKTLRQPCSVFLADQRERPTVAEPATQHPGWYWLRVDAKNLPAAALAKSVPADDAALTVPSVDPQTGIIAFTQMPGAVGDVARRAVLTRSQSTRQADIDANFAFDATGGLLVIDRAVPRPTVVLQAKAAGGSFKSENLTVRPFTEAERAVLQQKSAGNKSK